MTSLWSSDLHLNDSPRDAYRWSILPWLERKATELGVDFIGITGDVTDAKDRHPALVVNRLAEHLGTSKHQWIFVTGNHDYVNPDCPFFMFLGQFGNVAWAERPAELHLKVADKPESVLLLPATKEWETLWAPRLIEPHEWVFMHGTFAGTLSENGFELPGIPTTFFPSKSYGHLFSGDIHTPGPVAGMKHAEYIGAPYRVRFGDAYNPRVVHIGTKKIESLTPPGISRHVVVVRKASDLDRFPEINEKDQVKIRVRLRRADYPEWRKTRNEILAEAQALGWDVCGVELMELATGRQRLDDTPETPAYMSPEEYVHAFAQRNKLSKNATEFGLSFLHEEAKP